VIHLLLIVVFLSSVIQSGRGGDGRVRLKERAAIGRDSLLLAAQDIAVMQDGSLLVSDKLDYRVKKFTVDGRQAATVGGRGRGPGQFQGPGPIDAHGDRIAVADFASGRIQLFSVNFDYLRTIRISGAVSDLCFDGEGKLWVTAVTLDRNRGLFQYDDSGKLLHAVGLKHASGDLFGDACMIAWMGKGIVAVAYYTRDAIELWDTSGNFVREFSIPDLPSKSPMKWMEGSSGESGLMIPDGSIFRGMTSDRNGHLYLLLADYGDYPGQEVVRLNEHGVIEQRLLLPEKTIHVQISGRGEILSIPAARDAVIRYRGREPR
jgi:sugar lactone lactonase YvrE